MADKQIYYLKPNRDHSFIKNGELCVLDTVNAEVELSAASYESFKDKFNTEPVNVPKAAKEEEADAKTESTPAATKTATK